MAYPKYDARSVSQGQRSPRSQGRGPNKLGTPIIDHPTRLVITSTDGVKNGGVQNTHWCPDEGTEWTCPHESCGQQFVRDEKGTSWRAR